MQLHKEIGSTYIFWRIPIGHQHTAHAGLPWRMRAHQKLQWRQAQPPPATSELRDQLRCKLTTVLSKNYFETGFVDSLTRYFAVPKGD